MLLTSLWSGYMGYKTDYHSENAAYEWNNLSFERVCEILATSQWQFQ